MHAACGLMMEGFPNIRRCRTCAPNDQVVSDEDEPASVGLLFTVITMLRGLCT